MLRIKQVEIADRVREEQDRLARVEARLRQIEQEGTMPTYDVVIKKVEPRLVASIRGVVSNYAAQEQLWNELDAYLAKHKANPVGPCLTIYHDTEFKERDVDLEVCEPLNGLLPGEGRAQTRELPGVEMVACLLHHGAFDHIDDTYNALMRWIETNGYRIVGPNREVYLRAVLYPKTDAEYPKEYLTGNEADRLTEVQFPVEKA